MCGIVGYVGSREAIDYLLGGLRRLEYRGYDSSGVAVIIGRRRAGRLQNGGPDRPLEACLAKSPLHGHTGIGHTRWATHGVPTDVNAHPHLGGDGELAVVHNGVIENFQSLKQIAAKRGLRVPFRHRYGSDRPPDRQLPEAAAAGRGHGGGRIPPAGDRRPARLGAAPGNLRPGDHLSRLAGGDDRRPAGQPAGGRRGRGRTFRRQRRLAAGRIHRQDRLPGRP